MPHDTNTTNAVFVGSTLYRRSFQPDKKQIIDTKELGLTNFIRKITLYHIRPSLPFRVKTSRE